MHRRHFLKSLAAAPLAIAGGAPRIGASDLEADIRALSIHGRPGGGTFESGVSRTGYSDADVAGRKFVMDLMRRAGAVVRVDAAGNIFAERAGRDPALPPLLFGSHIDSVAHGGNFDGVLGSLSAIQVLKVLQDNGIVTRRPLSAVIWACEESSFAGRGLNGSSAAAGIVKPGEMSVVSQGLTKAEAIRKIGGNPDRMETAEIRPGAYHAYVELHIEQGGRLAREKVPAGIVEGIVAIDAFQVTVTGFANHAGTTPMAERRDALLAASELALALREIVTSEPGGQVGTVGHLEVSPNAPNVVPGEVRMSLEMRDLSAAKLDRLGRKVRERAEAIARESQTKIEFAPVPRHDPALADAKIQQVIQAAAGRLRLDTLRLPSGAGHDAQNMAKKMPMGMIFVPSVRGISHSPKEFTDWQDCANGANLLLETVLSLAA